ncbi:hypothetical protein [Desulfohalovibrio reitneri]|uniref:hypothetical protein n=1 Tax=Desulfohalovibrio reitneri TaxID=1307759 RepID=UPI0004A76A71|nr:hypothetical protein [Desulfohalovibrio reitneri]
MQVDPYQASFFNAFQTAGRGAGASGQQAGADMVPAQPSPEQAQRSSRGFGLSVAQRLDASDSLLPGKDEEAGRKSQIGNELAESLARTSSWLRDRFGEQTASAFQGLVSSAAGSGGEAAMGEAMLRAVRMVDSQHGLAAGDSFISQLNGDLNHAVNKAFADGFNQVIYAGNGQGSPLRSVAKTAVDGVAARFGQQAADQAEALLMENLSSRGARGLRQGLGEVMDMLESDYGADADQARQELDTLFGQAASRPAPGTAPAKGGLLDARA